MPHPLNQVPPAACRKLEALIAKLPAGLTIGRVVHTPHGWGVTLLDERGEVAAQVGTLDEEEEAKRPQPIPPDALPL